MGLARELGDSKAFFAVYPYEVQNRVTLNPMKNGGTQNTQYRGHHAFNDVIKRRLRISLLDNPLENMP